MTMKENAVVDGADYDDCHDGNPHGVNDVALDCPVDEYTVADQFIVVEVAANDRGPEVDDGAGDVDDADAEQDTANAHATLDAHAVFTTDTID